MKSNISALIITKNNEETIEKTFQSLKRLTSEIIVVDGSSIDNTVDILKKYKAKVYSYEPYDVGKQRAYGLKRIKTDWVLALDSDEVVSEKLKGEIKKMINRTHHDKVAYHIPVQGYFLGKPLNFGGERYKKLALFKKDSVFIRPATVHEVFQVKKGKTGNLRNKINHYSYRSLGQIYSKFTDYAVKVAKVKARQGEKTSLKKIFLYPLHMFHARFIKEKGYKDGLFRLPLDLGFAYMEFLTYFLLLFADKKKRIR